MKKFTFDVPCVASLQVEAETEAEAFAKATKYLNVGNDLDVVVDLADGYHFEMLVDNEPAIELLDEEDIDA